MESKCLEEELTCVICLGLYKEPAVLPCQHSFCLRCIQDYWVNKDNKDVYDCPQCRCAFPSPPSLEKNFTLCNIVEKLWVRRSQPDVLVPGVLCDFCMDVSSCAIKTCLKCETSFCSFHLQTHITKLDPKEHKLVNPIGSFLERKCSEHGKTLEFYCREDQCCVCVSCTVLGNHRNHTVISLEEAANEELKEEISGIHENLFNVSRVKLFLKRAEADLKVSIENLKKLTSHMFMELQKRMKEDELYMLRQIDSEGSEVVARIEQHCQEIEGTAQSMKLRLDDMQDMMNRDPFSLIQATHQSTSRDKKKMDILEPQPTDVTLDEDKVLKILKERLHETQMYQTATWNILSKKKLRQSLTFDVNTTHPNLIVSEDQKTVSWSDSRQAYPPHQERFSFDPQVLCTNFFHSGTHTWDVCVSGDSFKIGIAYRSLDRKKLLPSFLGHNSMSWCISYIKGDIKAWHHNICTNVAQIDSPPCIRVHLDYEAGTLAFYHTANTLLHLYTFKTTFSEPVYPAFKCGENTSITLC
ncbi:E3 ubiquitin/ISG15 ligase TRIM25-like isoform X1 [Lepisosteus oculatus]|uniref:E3 ubiquitin/ISG15 ligase TRIM25-like isoform X1 n=1 Tax=Lepisosteus oculatus TaxID=7918 RepID=UPI0035F51008